jgi:hypothetical protein
MCHANSRRSLPTPNGALFRGAPFVFHRSDSCAARSRKLPDHICRRDEALALRIAQLVEHRQIFTVVCLESHALAIRRVGELPPRFRGARCAAVSHAGQPMTRAKRVCKQSGCPTIVDGGHCDEHARQADKARGRRQVRGYTTHHDQLRARWAPRVALGIVDCHAHQCLMLMRRILPGTPWDLGHTADRQAWTGPEHARCNRAAGGRAAHGG